MDLLTDVLFIPPVFLMPGFFALIPFWLAAFFAPCIFGTLADCFPSDCCF